jgi:hypothetical protein
MLLADDSRKPRSHRAQQRAERSHIRVVGEGALSTFGPIAREPAEFGRDGSGCLQFNDYRPL